MISTLKKCITLMDIQLLVQMNNKKERSFYLNFIVLFVKTKSKAVICSIYIHKST